MIIYGPDRDSFQYKEMDEETMQLFKELIAKFDDISYCTMIINDENEG